MFLNKLQNHYNTINFKNKDLCDLNIFFVQFAQPFSKNMVIKNVKLKNFRNYDHLNLDLSDGINILHGKNAQGKTNFLESVYLCCVGKSLRGKDKELIKHGSDKSFINILAKKNYGMFTVDVTLSKNENKRILLNGIPILKMGELMGGINCVYFSPDELSLIKDAPQCRRRFLDIDISQTDKKYFYTLLSYNKTLMQRNNILKSRDSSLKGMIDVYNDQLAVSGGYIIEKREEFLRTVSPAVNNVHKFITQNENMEITYQTTVKEVNKSENLLKLLRDNIEKDLNLGYTTQGPHRDDIKISVNNIDIRVYGSQGQQRTCALSLKLGELKYFEDTSGEKPILLLDDVFSELDDSRQQKLIEACKGVQTIITATGCNSVDTRFLSLYNVFDGVVEKN